jgi:hypothetical protein
LLISFSIFSFRRHCAFTSLADAMTAAIDSWWPLFHCFIDYSDIAFAALPLRRLIIFHYFINIFIDDTYCLFSWHWHAIALGIIAELSAMTLRRLFSAELLITPAFDAIDSWPLRFLHYCHIALCHYYSFRHWYWLLTLLMP